jgi:enoyl-CoA hydratase/carnithine racemase
VKVDSDGLLVEDNASTRIITFNRPSVHNAQDVAMLEKLDEVLVATALDPAVRFVILTGAGRSFSSGHDLRQVFENPAYAQAVTTAEGRHEQELRLFVRPVERFRRLPMATACVVRGYCLAAGLMFAASADFVVAQDDALFGSPIARHIGVADAEVFTVALRIGERRAKQLVWLDDRLEAGQALAAGLVNWVEPADRMDDRVRWLTERITMCPPETLRLLKQSFQFAADRAGERDVNAFHFMVHQLSHHTSESKSILEARIDSLGSGGGPIPPGQRE